MRSYTYLLLLFASLASAESYQIFSSATSLNYSQSSPLYQMYKNTWQDKPQADGEIAFTRNRFSLGFKNSLASLEYIERYDWAFNFSPDTSELFYLEGGDRPIPANIDYQLDLSAKQLAAYGLRIGLHAPEWQRIKFSGFVNVLRGREFQKADIQGKVFQPDNNLYKGNASINYHYSNDLILEHDVNNPSATGYSFDLDLQWNYKNMALHLRAEDLFLHMHWQNVGLASGQLNTETVAHNPDGFIHYKPLFSGRRGIVNYTQTDLPVFVHGEASYQFQTFNLAGGAWYYHQTAFPFFKTSMAITERQQVAIGYELTSQKVTLSYQLHTTQTKNNITFGTDNFDPRSAHALTLAFNSSYRF